MIFPDMHVLGHLGILHGRSDLASVLAQSINSLSPA